MGKWHLKQKIISQEELKSEIAVDIFLIESYNLSKPHKIYPIEESTSNRKTYIGKRIERERYE